MVNLRESRRTLPREEMLKRAGDIRRILENGTKRVGKNINAFTLDSDRPRFAVLIPKRIGNAIRRNLMKRLAREIFRQNRHLFPDQDVILFVKRFNKNYRKLEKEIEHLANQQ